MTLLFHAKYEGFNFLIFWLRAPLLSVSNFYFNLNYFSLLCIMAYCRTTNGLVNQPTLQPKLTMKKDLFTQKLNIQSNKSNKIMEKN